MEQAGFSESDPPGMVCAISGGSGAGKTTLANKLLTQLGDRGCHITIDWYYRDLCHLEPHERNKINYDHPNSLEIDLFLEDLDRLRSGRSVQCPVYDFANHTRSGQYRTVSARPIVVTEGIHLLALEGTRERYDLLVYLDVAADLRLERRIRRDIVERGRTADDVRAQWQTTVAPMHAEFVEPSKSYADRIVSSAEDLDEVAIELARHFYP